MIHLNILLSEKVASDKCEKVITTLKKGGEDNSIRRRQVEKKSLVHHLIFLECEYYGLKNEQLKQLAPIEN
ncbi:MAG: hypothetical protein ACSHXL_00970 [Bacteroidota bacterium]